MLRVLVVMDWYIPGYKSGGPVRTVANLVDRLGDSFRFLVLTTDRDWSDSRPYDGIKPNCWTTAGKAEVCYVPKLSCAAILRHIRKVRPDVIYLNSFYSVSTIRTLLLRRLGWLPRVPVVIAVRGQFKNSALHLKASKKRVFRKVAIACGLYNDLVWQATSDEEKEEIESLVPSDTRIYVAPNLPPAVMPTVGGVGTKTSGEARIVYMSRVSPIKNTRWLLEALRGLHGKLVADIYGPIDDERYWRQQCMPLMTMLPANVTVTYRGPMPNENVPETLARYHFFALPTLGENYGHAILEAMAAGCPVIISDRTPWHNLSEHGGGWELPLDSPRQWTEVLQRCVDMDAEEHRRMSEAARTFALRYMASEELNQPTVRMLTEAARSQVNGRRIGFRRAQIQD